MRLCQARGACYIPYKAFFNLKLYAHFHASHNQEVDQHIPAIAALRAESLILHQVDKPANCFELQMPTYIR